MQTDGTMLARGKADDNRTLMNPPCPQNMHTHFAPSTDNLHPVTNIEFFDYQVCLMEINEACMAGTMLDNRTANGNQNSVDPALLPNLTTHFKHANSNFPPAKATLSLDDNTCQPIEILLQLKQTTAQCALLQLLFAQLLTSLGHHELHHPAATPAFSPPSDALPTLMQYPTKQESTWLLTHPYALNHAPIQTLFLDKLPSVECYQTICMPPCPPLPLLGCNHTLTLTSYHTQTPILPPPALWNPHPLCSTLPPAPTI